MTPLALVVIGYCIFCIANIIFDYIAFNETFDAESDAVDPEFVFQNNMAIRDAICDKIVIATLAAALIIGG